MLRAFTRGYRPVLIKLESNLTRLYKSRVKTADGGSGSEWQLRGWGGRDSVMAPPLEPFSTPQAGGPSAG